MIRRAYRFVLPLVILLASLASPSAANAASEQASDAHTHSLPASAITAQAARESASARTLELLSLHKRWLKAPASERAQLHQQLLAKAEQRRQLLGDLMQSHPAEVLRVTIPEDKQGGMPPEVVAKLEQRVDLEGELEVVYEDYEDGSHKLRHFLKTPFGERFELHFADLHSNLQSSKRVRVNGLLLDGNSAKRGSILGAMALESTESSLEFMDCCDSTASTTSTTPELSSTYGDKRALVILVNFQDKADQPWTQEEVRHVFFDQTSAYFQENSFGQTSLSGDVAGWYTLPLSSTTCNEGAISTYAHEAAKNAGVNVGGYDRYIYIFPQNSCPWAGRGQLGGWPTSAWLNGYMQLQIVSHELGHNFGLGHSKSLDCDAGAIEGYCYTRGYGDTLDTMGNYNAGHYNAFHKERLGWLGYNSMPDILTVESSGTYTLSPYSADNGGTRALKVLRSIDPSTGRKTWYYIEYRQAQGFDSFINDPENTYVAEQNVLNGVVIHMATDGDYDSSKLLDMTPESVPASDFSDPALMASKSFSDSDAGIVITTNWVDGNQASVDINLGAQPCVATNPSLSLSSVASSWVEAGTAVNYNVTLTNNDSSYCSSSTFSLSAVLPSGWANSFADTGLQLAPGESASTTLTVTSPSTAVDGYYDINVTATNGSYSTSGYVTYVVETPTTTNLTPVAGNDSTSTSENTAVTIYVLANDSDPDGDTLTVSSVSGVNGTATINSNGSITFTPANGFAGTETFSYTISDGQGGSASASVSVTVTATEHAPVAVNDSVSLSSKSPVTISVLNNDYDPDGDTLKITSVTQGSKGSVTINADGTLTFTPAKNFKDSDTFSYTASDGQKAGSAMVSITLMSDSSSSNGGKGSGNSKP